MANGIFGIQEYEEIIKGGFEFYQIVLECAPIFDAACRRYAESMQDNTVTLKQTLPTLTGICSCVNTIGKDMQAILGIAINDYRMLCYNAEVEPTSYQIPRDEFPKVIVLDEFVPSTGLMAYLTPEGIDLLTAIKAKLAEMKGTITNGALRFGNVWGQNVSGIQQHNMQDYEELFGYLTKLLRAFYDDCDAGDVLFEKRITAISDIVFGGVVGGAAGAPFAGAAKAKAAPAPAPDDNQMQRHR